MRLTAAAVLGFLLGTVLACGELVAVFLVSDLLSEVDLRATFAEIVEIELRYGMFMAIGLAVIALFRPQWSLRQCAGVALGGGFFVVCGWWVHRQLLHGIRLWEVQSILATLVLIIVSIAVGWLAVRVGRRRPRALILGLLALSVLCPMGLALTYPPLQSLSEDDSVPLAAEDLPDITLIVIDTLRADRLSCYGNPRQSSPVIDAVASHGARFETAVAQSSWTRPSMASLHSGTYPSSHGVNSIYDALPQAVTTIAEMLHARGYRTGAFSANAIVSPTFAFDQGFDYFWNTGSFRLDRYTVWGQFMRKFVHGKLRNHSLQHDDAEVVTAKVIDWLDQESPRPVFTYIHYIDPHGPYDPPDYLFEGERPQRTEFRAKATKALPFPFGVRVSIPEESKDVILDLYDAEIRYCDRAIGKLLHRLGTFGRLEETDFLVITADHGEQFYEHRHWGHGRSLFSEEIQVPLIIQGPGVPAGLVVRDPVSLIDLHPTIAEWAGAVPPAGLPTQSLQPLMEALGSEAPRLVYSELLSGHKHFSLQVATSKIIELLDAERENQPFFMTFDLAENPSERVYVEPAQAGAPLDRRDPSFTASTELRELLARVKEEASHLRIEGGTAVEVPEEVLDQLRALGYLDD